MAKIRALKPTFFTDEDMVEISPLARLLYQGMWCHACDNGHLEDRPKQLKLRILPADDCDVDKLIREIESVGSLTRSGGWLHLLNLSEHQKPDRRYFLTCDFPGCSKPSLATRREAPPDPYECPPDPIEDVSDLDVAGASGFQGAAGDVVDRLLGVGILR